MESEWLVPEAQVLVPNNAFKVLYLMVVGCAFLNEKYI